MNDLNKQDLLTNLSLERISLKYAPVKALLFVFSKIDLTFSPLVCFPTGLETFTAFSCISNHCRFSAFPDEQDLDADRLIREEYDLEQPEDTKIPTQEYR